MSNLISVWYKFESKAHDIVYKSVKTGLRKAANVLKNATKMLLRKSVNVNRPNKYKKYGDKITNAVMVSFKDNKKESLEAAKVHIMGKRDSDSGTFRARFFEAGTKERFRKKYSNKPKNGRSGSINSKHYFKDAQDETKDKLKDKVTDELKKIKI